MEHIVKPNIKKDNSKFKNNLFKVGMGFGMGFFIGSVSGAAHLIFTKMPLRGNMGHIMKGAVGFGVIMGVGSLLREDG